MQVGETVVLISPDLGEITNVNACDYVSLIVADDAWYLRAFLPLESSWGVENEYGEARAPSIRGTSLAAYLGAGIWLDMPCDAASEENVTCQCVRFGTLASAQVTPGAFCTEQGLSFFVRLESFQA